MSTALAPALLATAQRAKCPYLGLIPYSEADARFFFGRDDDTQLIVANLFSARVTTMFGASGVGKSSILRAGVIRDLQDRMAAAVASGGKPDLLVVYFNRWQGHVMADLRIAIHDGVASLTGDDIEMEGKLVDVLQHITEKHELDVMLLFDQFEEYFRYETRFGEPGSFAAEFSEAVQRTSMPVSFLLSLREDSLAELDRFKMLVGNLLSNWYRLERLSPEAAEKAILGPVEEYNKLPDNAREYGGRIEVEPALVGEIIAQVRKGSVTVGEAGKGRARAETSGIETPYLQLVLVKLWEREMAAGSKKLRLATLNELNGAREIVRSHVDMVMQSMSADEQGLAEVMFDYLVTDSGAKIAWRAGDLAEKAEVPGPEMKGLLEKLTAGAARVLTTVAPSPDHPNEPQYEIFHDMLGSAVLSWRRRRIESRTHAKRVRQVAAVLLAGVLIAALYSAFQQNEKSKAIEYGRALQIKDAQLQEALNTSRTRRLEAEANAKKIEAFLLEREGNSKMAAELRKEAQVLKQEAVKSYSNKAVQSVPKYDVGKTHNVANEAAELAAKNVQAAQAETARLRRENQDLQSRLDRYGKGSQGVQQQAVSNDDSPRLIQLECRLNGIVVHQDGGTGPVPWEFTIAIRGEERTITVRVDQEFNDGNASRVVPLRRAWGLAVSSASPILRIDIKGRRADDPGVQIEGHGVLEAREPQHKITVAGDNPAEGSFVFNFSAAPRAPASAR